MVHDLIGAEVPGLDQAVAILITRPDAEVLVAPASTLMVAVLDAAENPDPIGNLPIRLSEPPGEAARPVDAIMRALVTLINAGALVRA